MFTVKLSTAMRMIIDVAIRLKEPLFIWGPPGAGKTEGGLQSVIEVHQSFLKGDFMGIDWCEELGLTEGAELLDIRASQYDSVDFRGFPGLTSNGLTTWHMPSTIPFVGNPLFSDKKLYVIFLDEANAANAAVSAVLYQMVQEHRVGEHILKPNVVIFAAGNREGDRGVTNRQPLPLANRFTHTEVAVDVDDWCIWAQRKGIHPIGPALMQFKRDALMGFDPSRPDKAFGTPRSWAKALKYFADQRMSTEVKQAAIAGAVGQANASLLWDFDKVLAKVPAMADILKAPTKVPVPEEAGLAWATAVSCSGEMDKKNVKQLHAYLKRFQPEYEVCAWTLALRRDKELYKCPEFFEVGSRLKVMFQGVQ